MRTTGSAGITGAGADHTVLVGSVAGVSTGARLRDIAIHSSDGNGLTLHGDATPVIERCVIADHQEAGVVCYERAAPRLLDQARACTGPEVPPVFGEWAIRMAGGLADSLEALPGQLAGEDPLAAGGLIDAGRTAAAALRDYVAWIETELMPAAPGPQADQVPAPAPVAAEPAPAEPVVAEPAAEPAESEDSDGVVYASPPQETGFPFMALAVRWYRKHSSGAR